MEVLQAVAPETNVTGPVSERTPADGPEPGHKKKKDAQPTEI